MKKEKITIQRITVIIITFSLVFSVMGCLGKVENTEDEAVITEDEAVSTENEAVIAGKEMSPWINSNVVGAVTDNTEVDLKDDFYLAVNYEFLKNAVPDEGQATKNSLSEMGDMVEERILGMMTDDKLEGYDAKLVQEFYELWLDWDGRNRIGMTELMSHIEKIEQIQTLDELTAYLTSEEAVYYGDALYYVTVSPDLEESEWYGIEICSIPLSLGDAAEYETLTSVGERKQKLHRGVATGMLKKAGYEESEIEKILDNEYAFEKEIASATMTTGDWHASDVVQKIINKVTLEELKESSPNYPIADIIKALGYEECNRINLEEPDWLVKMNELYTEENLQIMKDCIMVHALTDYAQYLEEDIFRENQKLSNEANGIKGTIPDEKAAMYCVKKLLPTSVFKLYAQEYLSEEMRSDVTAIVEEIVDTYREMLSTEEWLSEETREMAIRKLDHITMNVAFPDKWEDTQKVSFTSKEEGGSLFQAMIELKMCYHEIEKEKVNTKVDPEIWKFDITKVNAYYSFLDNSINIIGGILGEPFYSPEMKEEEKMAGIGMVIGHEISHAFDTQGARFDENGNCANWWTEEDFDAFDQRAQKLIAYYDTIVPFTDGENYPGSNVQGEVIADMAGLKCMMMLAKERKDFDYDAFFCAQAKILKSVATLEKCENQVYQNAHPMAYLRVNVTFMQQPEFYETYGIKEGDGMYMAEEDRIAVW